MNLLTLQSFIVTHRVYIFTFFRIQVGFMINFMTIYLPVPSTLLPPSLESSMQISNMTKFNSFPILHRQKYYNSLYNHEH